MNDTVRFSRISLAEQELFAKRLAALLRAGVPISEAVRMIAGHSRGRSAALYAALAAEVEAGRPLSTAMEARGAGAEGFAAGIVRAGEASGTLPESLEYLAGELRGRASLRRAITGALAYPALIAVATLGIALSLTLYIFPKITPVFRSFRAELPLSTRILMAFSDFLARRWWAVALALAAAALGSALLLRLPRVRRTADRALLGAPLLGPLLRRYNLAQLSRTISLLLASGVRIVGALEVASAGNGNAAYRAALAEAATEVAKGRDLSAALAGRPRLFPGLFLSMAAVGERAGDLPGALSHLSRMYADELEASAKRFSTLLEPGLMMAMGLLVGFIAVAIIAPIYGITERLSPGGF